MLIFNFILIINWKKDKLIIVEKYWKIWGVFMSRRGKKIAFVILDIFILGFLGLYLSFNLNYDEDNPTSGDFTLRMLDNNTTDT